MKKAEIMDMEPTAYYGGFSGLEIKGIEYGADDYLLCVSGAWSSKHLQKPHRLKIHYDDNGGFVRLYGYKVPLNECIRVAAC